VVTKAGQAVPKNAAVRVNAQEPKFVCRAGFKLEKALDHFAIDVTGLAVLDAGLSTGGFTHCLLQRGARHVRAWSGGGELLHAACLLVHALQ
jgi:23S rRNA (cytidine1920-2'-O)/16S rRNA (cytidine1409-2'-O)-methyltransferase